MYAKLAFTNITRRIWRSFFTVIAIAISVAFPILLISVAVSMNQGNEDALNKESNFWVMPSGGNVLDPVTNSQKTMIGNVHQRIDTLKTYPEVKAATPILNKVIYAAKKQPKVVLGFGLIPDGVNFVEPDALSAGDPHYYGKEFTREVALNRQLSDLLGAQKGDLIYLGMSENSLLNSTPFKVTAIVESMEFSIAPVAILHLSELQDLTGNLKGDRANQFILKGEKLTPLLRSYFPDASVLSEDEYYARSIEVDKRTLATSITVSAVSLVLGILFITSTMIFSVNEKQKEFAVMRAIGISDSSIMKIVMYESVMISVIGGILGVITGILGKFILNAAILSFFGIVVIPSSNPLIVIGAFSTAVIAGIISGIVPAMKKANIAGVLGS